MRAYPAGLPGPVWRSVRCTGVRSCGRKRKTRENPRRSRGPLWCHLGSRPARHSPAAGRSDRSHRTGGAVFLCGRSGRMGPDSREKSGPLRRPYPLRRAKARSGEMSLATKPPCNQGHRSRCRRLISGPLSAAAPPQFPTRWLKKRIDTDQVSYPLQSTAV